MSERTTRRQVEAQASRLARELGYRTAAVSAGSVSNGVAWTVTMTTAERYADAWRDGNDTVTLSLHRGMSATFDMLHDMAEGASLANLRREQQS